MNHTRPSSLLLMLVALLPLAAQSAGTVQIPMVENGVTTAYFSVPSGFECGVSIPDMPTAFCSGPGSRVYHLQSFFQSQPTDPQQYLNTLMQQIHATEPNTRILQQYQMPGISQHLAQADSVLTHLAGQQVVTLALDVEDPDAQNRSVVALVIKNSPNNGAPVSTIVALGITVPANSQQEFDGMRDELLRFVRSYRYDPGWVQSANASHIQFLNNQRMKQNNFAQTQQRIHQNNMDALDSSFNSYMGRSASSSRSQSQYVDSIHERQTLVDPNSGTLYQADGYAGYNYVNPNDPSMYYRTDNPLYDPNVNTNQGEDYIQLQEYFGR